MPPTDYNWVPDELVETADDIAGWMRERGYVVKVEYLALGFPFPPTFAFTRGKLERVLVEVLKDWQEDRIQTWVAYGRTCQKELKLAVAFEGDAPISRSSLQKARELGVGVLRAGGIAPYFEIEPNDLSMRIALPPLRSLTPAIRQLIGAAYDHLEASRFREGFDEACRVFERATKRYLKKWIKTGRLTFIGPNGRPVTYTEQRVDRMTMGALKIAFEQIQAQTQVDRRVLQTAESILKDRNNLTHDKWNARTEQRLRRNVGPHMWVITQTLKDIL